jgi:hypothetical protein
MSSNRLAPERLIQLHLTELYALPPEEQAEIQLAGLRTRFAELRERITIVGKMTENQGVREIRRIEDAAPLLLPHSTYKSYSLSVIERGQFDRLTRWLAGLTSHDLAGLDASKCETIDEWIELLDARTPIRVIHSTGTTGKLSFLPRSVVELEAMVTNHRRTFDVFPGELPRINVPVEQAPVIFPWYRHGAMAYHRLFEGMLRHLFAGDEGMIFALNPARLSADAISLAGRLRAAEAKGELGQVQIAPKIAARREALLKEQGEAPQRVQKFIERLRAEIAGRSVAVMGALPQLFDLASAGVAQGAERLFDPVSHVAAGGGNKGRNLPDGWDETVKRFLGVPRLSDGYGMSESIASSRACTEKRYHVPAHVVPFVLDPQTGVPAPRSGTVTGRFGIFDLNARSYWGGFLTGDKVTLSWADQPCACGRLGPYVHAGIRRFTESEGGDDKITCAGAPDAHERAIEFILKAAGG